MNAAELRRAIWPRPHLDGNDPANPGTHICPICGVVNFAADDDCTRCEYCDRIRPGDDAQHAALEMTGEPVCRCTGNAEDYCEDCGGYLLPDYEAAGVEPCRCADLPVMDHGTVAHPYETTVEMDAPPEIAIAERFHRVVR